jgi:hypothetical protein
MTLITAMAMTKMKMGRMAAMGRVSETVPPL